MSTHTVNGFIVATRHSLETKATFGFQMHKPSAEFSPETVVVREHQVEIEVDEELDITGAMVANLEEKKRLLRVELAKNLMRIDNDIGKLTSLEFVPAPIPGDDIPF